jgi:hypothetical protein
VAVSPFVCCSSCGVFLRPPRKDNRAPFWRSADCAAGGAFSSDPRAAPFGFVTALMLCLGGVASVGELRGQVGLGVVMSREDRVMAGVKTAISGAKVLSKSRSCQQRKDHNG